MQPTQTMTEKAASAHRARVCVKTPIMSREVGDDQGQGHGQGHDHGEGHGSRSMSRTDGEFEGVALHLSTTVSNFMPPASTAPSRIGFDLDAEFNYNSEAVTPQDAYDTDAAVLQHRYKRLCSSLGVVPHSIFLKQIGQSHICIQGAGLTSLDLKAILTLLVLDTELTQLELSGNKFGVQEVQHITQLLTSNRFLAELSLCDNHLTGDSLTKLVPTACSAKLLRYLDLSGNNLCDKDCKSLCQLLEDTECLSELILHHNELGQCGQALGIAIATNDTITNLNLSWNHIRGAGAVGIAKGIEKNSCLVNVNLSWNGFGYEGSVGMGAALKANTTLHKLDLTNNRIHPPALFQLWQGVCANKTLTSLNLSKNPIPAHIPSYMLDRLAKWKHGNLRELGLQGMVVDKDFEKLLEEIRDERAFFVVHYDGALNYLNTRRESKVDAQNIYNIDPMRILFFMKEHLRTIDLFLKIDQNHDGVLSREEMRYAFELEGFPISDKALDQVMSYLDINKSGEVDLGEFFQGERKMRREQAKEKMEAAEKMKLLQREGAQSNPLQDSPSLIQTVGKTYSQAFKKPPPRVLPKINKS